MLAKHKKSLRIFWILVAAFVVLSMVAFLAVPLFGL
jgi:hypothetical protein